MPIIQSPQSPVYQSPVARFARAILGPVPSPVGTTIGAGASPLMDEEGYFRKVLGASVDDLRSHYGNILGRTSPAAKNIVGNAVSDPLIGAQMGGSGYQPTGSSLREMIQRLADAYMPSYSGPDGPR